MKDFISGLLCFFGAHDWSDGPGYPCAVCGHVDTYWQATTPIKTGIRPHFNENGIYIDKFGHKCVCGKCKPPQVINCDTLAKCKEAEEYLNQCKVAREKLKEE